MKEELTVATIIVSSLIANAIFGVAFLAALAWALDWTTARSIDEFQRSLHRGQTRTEVKAMAKSLGGFDTDWPTMSYGEGGELSVRFSYLSAPCTSYGPEYDIDFTEKGLSSWTSHPYHEAC